MHATIRRYEGIDKAHTDELTKKVGETYLPRVSKLDGFRGYYLIETGDIILPEDYASDPSAVKNITQRFTSAFEALVRKSPEQYFWLHRRWKHQPAPRKSKKAA